MTELMQVIENYRAVFAMEIADLRKSLPQDAGVLLTQAVDRLEEVHKGFVDDLAAIAKRYAGGEG